MFRLHTTKSSLRLLLLSLFALALLLPGCDNPEQSADASTDADHDGHDADRDEACEVEGFVTARPELFDEILNHLLTEETLSEGDWDEDFGDATCYAPPVLLAHGLGLCQNAEISLGWETIEHEYRLIDEFLGSASEAMIGGIGLTQVYALAPGDELAEKTRKLIELVETTLPVIGNQGLLPESISEPYGPTAATAIVSALLLLYVDAVDGEDVYVRDRGLEIADDIDAAAFDEEGGFYRRAPEDEALFLYPNVAMILVHALAHRSTGDSFHLDRARALITAIEALWLPEVEAYHSPYQGEGNDYVSLSSQNYTAIALLFLFDETGDAELLEAVRGRVDFIESSLYSEGVAYHHWEHGERADWYCPGCNFQLLYVLWQLGLRGG